MKKIMILAIGIVALFIGIAAIPAYTAIETKPMVESQADPRYAFSGKAFFCVQISEGFGVSFLPIIGLATIEGECSYYDRALLGVYYRFDIQNEADYATVDPWIGEKMTYTYEDIGSDEGSSVRSYFIRETVEITEI